MRHFIFLYPDPVVELQEVDNDDSQFDLFCVSDPAFKIEARVFTYNNKYIGTEYEISGGQNFVDTISNEYILEYYGTDETYNNANLIGRDTIYNSNFNPSDPNQNGIRDDYEIGFIIINYTSEALVPLQLTGSDTWKIRVEDGGVAPEISDTGDMYDAGGYDSNLGHHFFEYCGGEEIYDINFKSNAHVTAEVKYDSIAVYIETISPQTLLKYYKPIDENSEISIEATDYLPSNPYASDIEVSLFVTRWINGCESEPFSIVTRVYSVPEAVELEDKSVVAGQYFYEFCYYDGIKSRIDTLKNY